MTPLFTPEAVRRMDARALDRGVSGAELMDRAAAALARVVLDTVGRTYGLRVLLLCGKGHNGGDGLAAATRLAQAGAAPLVWLAAEDAQLSTETAARLRRWRAAGGRVVRDLPAALARADVVVDCLLGTGTGGVPRGAVAQAVDALTGATLPVVACDLPTGVDAATGAVPGPAVRADVTLTIGAEKVGLRLWPARGHCGRLRCADIGIRDGAEPADALVLDDADVAALVPPPDPQADKRVRGVVLVVAGSPGMTGAAILTARGALAAGAGLVTVALPAGEPAVVAAAVPEALTLALPEEPEEAAALVLARAAASDAVVLGPGRGTTPAAVTVTRRVVRDCERPLVLDADGLNAYRHDGEALADHASPLLVLTPHRRELARLVADGAAGADDGDDLWRGRFTALPILAARWRATLLAKGPGTLVAAPDGRRWVNATGGPALATGGTGDVLAGMLGALVAQDPRSESVAAGVHLHGLAADLAAARGGVRSTGPLDVAAAVADAFARFGEAA